MPQETEGPPRGTVEGFEEKATAKEKAEFKGKCYKSGKTGHMSKDCRSNETSAFEADEEGLAETGCIEMASIDLNALEIGAVQLLEKDHKIRIGIDSCAAVTVFPKTVAGRLPDAANARQSKEFYRPASRKLPPDLGAGKVQVKLRDGSLRCVNPGVADTHRALMVVSEMNDMGHDVFLPQWRQRHQGACVPRGQWHEAGARESEWSVRVASRACSIQSEYFEEQHFMYVFFSVGAATDRGHD